METTTRLSFCEWKSWAPLRVSESLASENCYDHSRSWAQNTLQLADWSNILFQCLQLCSLVQWWHNLPSRLSSACAWTELASWLVTAMNFDILPPVAGRVAGFTGVFLCSVVPLTKAIRRIALAFEWKKSASKRSICPWKQKGLSAICVLASFCKPKCCLM